MTLLLVLICSLATTLASQALVTMQARAPFAWALERPDAFLLTWGLIAGATLWVALLKRSARFGLTVVHGGLLALATVSFLKGRQFGNPLYPWDFSLAREFLMVLPDFLKSSVGVTAGLALTTAIGLALYRRFPRGEDRLRPRARWSLFAGLTVTLALVFLANNPVHGFLFHEHFQANVSRPKLTLRDNGLVLGFVLLKEHDEVYAPPGYSRDEFLRLQGDRTFAPHRHPSGLSHPDIVVVMSESFFDPLQLEGVKWKKDPLSFTRSLAARRPLSLSVVPTFGGRTGNSEFEFLTGFSTSFFAKGTVPYIKYIDKPKPSLARSLRDAGYKTIAVHPGGRSAYSRGDVYPLFGFDEFHATDDLPNLRNYGNQVSDESILPFLKESMAKNEGPTFHFVVTIQNHYPYNPNPFEFKDPPFENEGLAKDEQVVLNYYGKLLEATDRFHRELVTFLETRKRPTVLLIFGDHLPPLLPQFGLFNGHLIHSDDPDSWSPQERMKMHSTPLVQWSNFALPDEDRPIQTSFLGARLLRKLDLPMTPFQEFVADWSDRHPVFKKELLPDADQVSPQDVNRYWIFQYGTFTHQDNSAGESALLDL